MSSQHDMVSAGLGKGENRVRCKLSSAKQGAKLSYSKQPYDPWRLMLNHSFRELKPN